MHKLTDSVHKLFIFFVVQKVATINGNYFLIGKTEGFIMLSTDSFILFPVMINTGTGISFVMGA